MKLQFNVKNLKADQVKVDEINIAVEYSAEEIKLLIENYPALVNAVLDAVKNLNN